MIYAFSTNVLLIAHIIKTEAIVIVIIQLLCFENNTSSFAVKSLAALLEKVFHLSFRARKVFVHLLKSEVATIRLIICVFNKFGLHIIFKSVMEAWI